MNIGRLGRMSAAVVLLAAGSASRSQAQEVTGSISGTVMDDQGGALPGATVTIMEERTGIPRTGLSDARGDFVFRALQPGSYTVRAEMPGFRGHERRSVILTASGRVSLGVLQLSLGAVSEVVSVVESGAKVNPEESQHTSILTSTQIEQIQTKGRDVINLLRALPGFRYMDDLESTGDAFGAEIPNVNGQRQEWNRVSVDGLNGNELSGSSRMASAINLDAVAEVKVVTTYKAEFGGSGGANIQIVSRGGGSEYKGSLYWFGRRTSWNANRWQNNKAGVERPRYEFDTFGFNLGGPVKIPGLFTPADNKLFFFYSAELPNVERPGPLRQFMLPTLAERRGDFSQSYVYGSPNARATIVDPLTGVPFPGNIIPADRIDPSMRALLDLMPEPNQLDTGVTRGNYNFIRQETSRNPRQNHLLRLDWRPSESDSLFLTARRHTSYQAGSEIIVGPSRWGWFAGFYDFGDASVNLGYNRVLSAHAVNEFSAGVRRQDEGFGADDPNEQERRLARQGVGYTLNQFHPELNRGGVVPRVILNNLTSTGVDAPSFTYEPRFGETTHDYVFAVRDNVTWTRGAHTFKAGAIFERVHNNEALGGTWMGEFTFGNSARTINPLAAGSTYANMLLGVFNSYTESDGYRGTRFHQSRLEWYGQDTWKLGRRLTLDVGLRFLWFEPWVQADDRTSGFVFERYDPAKAPRLYVPAPANTARDIVTGQVVPGALGGTFVPGTGDIANGMVTPGPTETYPRSFRDNPGIHPEPRLGLAWDVFGRGKTVLHASAGLFHQYLSGNEAGGVLSGPPTHNLTDIPNALTRNLFDAGQVFRPTTVRSLERDAKTQSAYSWTLGITQDLGWGSAVDVTYVGSVNRHLAMRVNYNEIPAGARLPGANINPLTGTRYPDAFLRPYAGYNDINRDEHWGTANYNALQVQLNRRYTKGLQFSAAYTFSKALGLGGMLNVYAIDLPFLECCEYAPLSHNQTHNFVANFTYDIPRVSPLLGGFAPARLLFDNWQISGEYGWASGDWAGITLATTTGQPSDIVGGSINARPVMTRNPRKSGGSPFDAANPWFDTTAFARPARGDYGNTPARVIQRPPINSLNTSLFKNLPLGKGRRLQLRLEAYNVLNHTQIRDVDRTARFDDNGQLVNASFGLATNDSRPPRILQGSVRFSF